MALGGGMIAAGVGSALIGANAQKKAGAAAAAQLDRINNLYAQLKTEVPTIQSQLLSYMPAEYLGAAQVPEEHAITAPSSEMATISTDPRLRQAQMEALSQLKEISDAGGLTDSDMAELRQVSRQISGDEQARQKTILADLASRGVGGSGQELAAKLSSSQASAQRQAEQADEIKKLAYQRALDAISQTANLSGNIRSQEFGEQSDVAKAKDEIAKFNAEQQAGAQSRNVGRQYETNTTSQAEQQRIAEQNLQQQRDLEKYTKYELPNNRFNQLYQITSGQAGMAVPAANLAVQQGQNQANMYGQIGAGTIAGLGAIGSRSSSSSIAPDSTSGTVNSGYNRYY